MNVKLNKLVKDYQQVTVNNALNYELTVFSTFSKTLPKEDPSLNAADYYPIYTPLGTIPSESDGGKQRFKPLKRFRD